MEKSYRNKKKIKKKKLINSPIQFRILLPLICVLSPRLFDAPSLSDSVPARPPFSRIPRSKHHMTKSNPRKNPADAEHGAPKRFSASPSVSLSLAVASWQPLPSPRCSPFPQKMAAIVHSSRVGQLDNARRSTMFAPRARSSLHHARHYRMRDYERYRDVIVIAR